MVCGKHPLHGLMVDGKFQFGHYKEFIPVNLFSEELKLGIQSGMYEYKIGGGWSFQSAPWMKAFFEEAFKRKAEAKNKKAGNKALAGVENHHQLSLRVLGYQGRGHQTERMHFTDGGKIEVSGRVHAQHVYPAATL